MNTLKAAQRTVWITPCVLALKPLKTKTKDRVLNSTSQEPSALRIISTQACKLCTLRTHFEQIVLHWQNTAVHSCLQLSSALYVHISRLCMSVIMLR
jgi:hypothetical protein